jgi:hypothetical protein
MCACRTGRRSPDRLACRRSNGLGLHQARRVDSTDISRMVFWDLATRVMLSESVTIRMKRYLATAWRRHARRPSRVWLPIAWQLRGQGHEIWSSRGPSVRQCERRYDVHAIGAELVHAMAEATVQKTTDQNDGARVCLVRGARAGLARLSPIRRTALEGCLSTRGLRAVAFRQAGRGRSRLEAAHLATQALPAAVLRPDDQVHAATSGDRRRTPGARHNRARTVLCPPWPTRGLTCRATSSLMAWSSVLYARQLLRGYGRAATGYILRA